MEDDKFIEALKTLKDIKSKNKEKVEKIKNTDLDEKKKIIKNIVNQRLIKKLIEDDVIYYKDYKLLWIDNNNNTINISQVIHELENNLNTI